MAQSPADTVREASSEDADLRGRSAVITGSSSGIGRAIALELAAAGADVLIHARSNRQAAQETVQLAAEHGVRATMVLADLAEPKEQDRLVDEAWRWAGGVDIWINNAGADVLTGSAADWSFEEKLAELLRVDLVATVRMSRQVGARMRESGRAGATILNVGWDQSATGMAGDSGEMFAATKGAVAAFSLSLAKSLAPHVRVNCLAPGWIRTAWGEQASDGWQQRARRESLAGRWGLPGDVARVAKFLVSPAAAFVNAQIVAVNGGRNDGAENPA